MPSSVPAAPAPRAADATPGNDDGANIEMEVTVEEPDTIYEDLGKHLDSEVVKLIRRDADELKRNFQLVASLRRRLAVIKEQREALVKGRTLPGLRPFKPRSQRDDAGYYIYV